MSDENIDITDTVNDTNNDEIVEKTVQAPVFKEPVVVEREEEKKLRSRYGNLRGLGQSNFLHKRLSKGKQYFDSGDYNMAKCDGKSQIKPPLHLSGSTGEKIPKPETVPSRKTSINYKHPAPVADDSHVLMQQV